MVVVLLPLLLLLLLLLLLVLLLPPLLLPLQLHVHVPAVPLPWAEFAFPGRLEAAAEPRPAGGAAGRGESSVTSVAHAVVGSC